MFTRVGSPDSRGVFLIVPEVPCELLISSNQVRVVPELTVHSEVGLSVNIAQEPSFVGVDRLPLSKANKKCQQWTDRVHLFEVAHLLVFASVARVSDN